MLSKQLSDESRLKTYSIVLATGDEAMTCPRKFATQHGLSAAQFSAIGALGEVDLARASFNELHPFPLLGSERSDPRRPHTWLSMMAELLSEQSGGSPHALIF